jgi:hypothetical protein
MNGSHRQTIRTKFSTIGRALDPSYWSNRLILILMAAAAAAGLIWGLVSGLRAWGAILTGGRSGLALFLGWALTREIDPDQEWAAFAAVGFTALGLVYLGQPELGVVFWVLLLLRVVNHTTGLSASLLDTLGLVGLGAWLSFRGNWGLSMLTGLALVVDAYLQDGKRRQVYLGLLSGLVGAGAFLVGGQPPAVPGLALVPAAAAAVLAALYAPVIAASRRVESTCDQTGEDMLARRIQAGQLLGLLIGLELALWSGWSGITAVSPLWGAAAGSLVVRFGRVVLKNLTQREEP